MHRFDPGSELGPDLTPDTPLIRANIPIINGDGRNERIGCNWWNRAALDSDLSSVPVCGSVLDHYTGDRNSCQDVRVLGGGLW